MQLAGLKWSKDWQFSEWIYNKQRSQKIKGNTMTGYIDVENLVMFLSSEHLQMPHSHIIDKVEFVI